jgi:hypothetical protein
MDRLLGFGRFHHFQIWVVQTVVAVLGRRAVYLFTYSTYMYCTVVMNEIPKMRKMVTSPFNETSSW